MLDILAVTVPIYLVIALGYFAVTVDIMSMNDVRALGRFVLNFAIPAMLFRMMSRLTGADIANIDLFYAYALASFAVWGLAVAVTCLAQGKTLRVGAFVSAGTAIANSGVIGYQVIEQSLGPAALPIIAIAIIIENIILALVIAMAESGEHDGRSLGASVAIAFGRLAKSPLIVSIVLGGLAAAIAFVPPRPIGRAIDMLAVATGPVALFTTGGTLVGVKVRGMIRDVIMVVAGKLLLHPAFVFGALFLFPAIEPRLQAAAIVAASVPIFSIFPIIGQKFGLDKFGAAAVLVATVISFVTISTVLAIVQASGRFGPLG
ncbi:AEC family transporter [Xanthobacteraceae bacterium Astr-EGSB]|uniref:AEC family transporter n=1 Tax=Astrobacterium formosum TaxID=3069710 RepID=UPI0027B1D55A|nr:AEC family transporter [Xanthobacteraceae bacterium Astr-EGSB]